MHWLQIWFHVSHEFPCLCCGQFKLAQIDAHLGEPFKWALVLTHLNLEFGQTGDSQVCLSPRQDPDCLLGFSPGGQPLCWHQQQFWCQFLGQLGSLRVCSL